MSDEKTYTAADMREAFVGGAACYANRGIPADCGPIANEAKRRFPDPKKPRVKKIGVDYVPYRVVDGVLEWQNSATSVWSPSVLNDLFAHPYEESK